MFGTLAALVCLLILVALVCTGLAARDKCKKGGGDVWEACHKVFYR